MTEIKYFLITILLVTPLHFIQGQDAERDIIKSYNTQVSLKNRNFPHVEPYLAVNPKDSKLLVATSMMYTKSGASDQIVTYFSMDGGLTWNPGHFPNNAYGVDPWLSYDQNGRVYIVYLPGIVHYSDNNGKTWSKGYRITGNPKNPYDFIKINTSQEHVYISASQSIRDDDGLLVAPISIVLASKDLDTIEPPIHILPGNFDYQVGVSAVENNYLMTPFYELTDIKGEILEYNRIWMTLYNPANKEVKTPRWTGFVGGSPALIRNPSFDHRLHLFWYFRTEKNSFIMKSSYTDDYGISWSDPVDVEDFKRHPGDFGVFPTVAITESGVIGVIWADTRTDTGSIKYGVYFSYSLDAGKSFSRSFLISSPPTSTKTERNKILIKNSDRTVAERFDVGGDYYGLVPLSSTEFMALWSDNKTKTLQLWSAKIEIPAQLLNGK